MKGNRLTELVKAALMGPVDEGNKFEAKRLKAIKAGDDHFEVDGKNFL